MQLKPWASTMLGLYLLLFGIAVTGAVTGIELEHKTGLDVISYQQWPILKQFSLELTDNAMLVNVYQAPFDVDAQAVLHDWRKKTYLHKVDPYYRVSNEPYKTREIFEISGLSVKDIKFGYHFIVILTEDGSVWTAGRNRYGELSGDLSSRPTFTKVQGIPAVKQIAAGDGHCTVLAEDGRLFSWGLGFEYGEALGYITTHRTNPIPRKFSLEQVEQGAALPTSICCSLYACMVLTEDAEVFTWGLWFYSLVGRPGDPRLPGRLHGIPSGETIIKVACGTMHMVALTSSGRLYGWGSNEYGELLQAANWMKTATELGLGGKRIREVVAGKHITIVKNDTDVVYYFGHYDRQSHYYATQLRGSVYPRDLTAKALYSPNSYGAVSLGGE